MSAASTRQAVEPTTAARAGAGAAGLACLLAAAAVLAVALSLRAITHSEVRYVEAAREMVAGGDWVVPHVSFVAYFEKPVFAYWAEAASQLLFGLSPLAARVPVILSFVGMVAATYGIGRTLRGPAFGLGAGFLLLGAALFDEIGTAVTTDPIFSAWLALAWFAFLRHDRAPRSGWIWVFWSALGLAVLTKGPLGLVLVGTTVGAYLLLDGRLRDVRDLRLVRGVLLVLAIQAPWSVLVWQRDPRYLQFFYVRENLQAFLDGEINHPQGPWYYLPLVPAAFFPFSILVAWAAGAELWATFAPAVSRLVRRSDATPRPDRGRLYVACMVLPPLVFLSASASKLMTYLLPLFPGVALLAAWFVADRLARPTAILRWATLAMLAVGVAAAAFAPQAIARNADVAEVLRPSLPVLVAGGAMLVVGLAAGGIAAFRGRVVHGLAFAGVGSCAALLCVNSVSADVEADRDAGALLADLVRVRKPGERVVLGGPCAEDFTVSWVLRERTAIWGFARELGMGHFTEVTPPSEPIPESPYDVCAETLPQNPWLLDDREMKAAWSGADRMWYIGRPKDVERLRSFKVPVFVLAANGSRSIACNQPVEAKR